MRVRSIVRHFPMFFNGARWWTWARCRVRTLAELSEARENPGLRVFPSNSVNTKTPKLIEQKSIPAISGHDPM